MSSTIVTVLPYRQHKPTRGTPHSFNRRSQWLKSGLIITHLFLYYVNDIFTGCYTSKMQNFNSLVMKKHICHSIQFSTSHILQNIIVYLRYHDSPANIMFYTTHLIYCHIACNFRWLTFFHADIKLILTAFMKGIHTASITARLFKLTTFSSC